MAKGVDVWASIIVLQKNPNIWLVATTPYPEFSIRWDET